MKNILFLNLWGEKSMDNKIFIIIGVVIIAVAGITAFFLYEETKIWESHEDKYVVEHGTGSLSEADAIAEAQKVVPDYATVKRGTLGGDVYTLPVYHNDYGYQIGTVGVNAKTGKIMWIGI